MAPIRDPPTRDAKPLKSILKNTSAPKRLVPESLFPTSKKDKRRIKHAQLMSKVTKSTSKPRRRRPNKKLVTTLDTLADALPNGFDVTNESSSLDVEQQVNVIRRKSMKSRPGAMKRREKLDNGERDRFAKNMGQLAAFKPLDQSQNALHTGLAPAPSSSDKWAALRGFISQTLELKPELKATT